MTDAVFYVPQVPAPGSFILGGVEGRHAATVRRMRPGEILVLSDGDGRWASATVTAVEKHRLVVDVASLSADPPPALAITLVQALPKGDRSDLAVDLATQAGADEIIPWQSARCVARWDASPDKQRKGVEKWSRVAREAAKQSRRHRVPVIHPLARLNEVVDAVSHADVAVILHEGQTRRLVDVDLPLRGRLVLVVGPEGGLAPEEASALAAAGGHVVRLGPEVLRSAAAAAVAMGAISVLTNRWA